MKRSYRILLFLVLSGTGELILGASLRLLNLAGAQFLMVLGLVSQISALAYSGYLSLRPAKASV